MEPHPVESWKRIIAEQTNGTPASVGYRILGDLIGYHHNSKDRLRDAQEIGNAIEAFLALAIRERVRL